MSYRRSTLHYIDDAQAGGSTRDQLLTPGPLPAFTAAKSLLVSTAQVNRNERQLTREQEVRGVRGEAPPVEFTLKPQVTASGILYPSTAKKLARLGLGGNDQRTGTPPAAITHKLESIETGNLPSIHAGIVRDDQYDKVFGLTLSELQWQFPIQDWATWTTEWWGKYAVRVSDAVPAADLSAIPRRGFLLRDAKAFIGGSPTPITNLLRQFNLTIGNQLRNADEEVFRQGANIHETLYGGIKRQIWFPDVYRLGQRQIRGQIHFGQVEPDEDLKLELSHAEQFVFEVAFEDLAGVTPAAREVMRITLNNRVLADGQPEPLARTDTITSTYDFGGFLDATNKDLKVEFVDASNVDIT